VEAQLLPSQKDKGMWVVDMIQCPTKEGNKRREALQEEARLPSQSLHEHVHGL